MDNQNVKKGIILGVSSYIIWGILPIYWKALDVARADIVLAHRIIWSFVFLFIFIMLTHRSSAFFIEAKRIFGNKKMLLTVSAASLIIGLNWLVFIWAVHHNQVVQASLGYYINPLMSVLLGIVFLKERLSGLQQLSFLLAGIGVTYLTIGYGSFPWIAVALAFSFAIYGLLKKIIHLDATFSLMIETILLTPIALFYLFYQFGPTLGFGQADLSIDLLLIGTGIISAVPLLLFGMAVVEIPLSLTGFLQYIAPTLMLLLGVFLYGEAFTSAHIVTFTFIWVSLVLYMYTTLKKQRRIQKQSVS